MEFESLQLLFNLNSFPSVTRLKNSAIFIEKSIQTTGLRSWGCTNCNQWTKLVCSVVTSGGTRTRGRVPRKLWDSQIVSPPRERICTCKHTTQPANDLATPCVFWSTKVKFKNISCHLYLLARYIPMRAYQGYQLPYDNHQFRRFI